MSAAVPDDLDALLASLLSAEPAPVQAVPASPVISPERAENLVHLRAWLLERYPYAKVDPDWQPKRDPGYELPEPLQGEQIEPELLAELVAARAWRDGDLAAFDSALARLPADRAAHHRRMAVVSDLIKARQ